MAPLTFSSAFLDARVEETSARFCDWKRSLGRRVRLSDSSEPLISALQRLSPLSNPQTKYLFMGTVSRWTALFANGLWSCDVVSVSSYLSRVLKCRAVAIMSVPDRSLESSPDILQKYGSVSFSVFGPEDTDFGLLPNVERHIAVINDGGTWRFDSAGPALAFEELEHYKRRRIKDRLTPAIVERYCQALGVDSFNEKWYRNRGVVVELPDELAPDSRPIAIEEARSRLHLAPES
jgi:hypothetical protein